MNNAVSAILAIVGGVISLAIISVIVSKNAQTPQVFTAAGGALGTVIGAAVSPVTGATVGTGAASGGFPTGGGGFGGLLSTSGASGFGGLLSMV